MVSVSHCRHDNRKLAHLQRTISCFRPLSPFPNRPLSKPNWCPEFAAHPALTANSDHRTHPPHSAGARLVSTRVQTNRNLKHPMLTARRCVGRPLLSPTDSQSLSGTALLVPRSRGAAARVFRCCTIPGGRLAPKYISRATDDARPAPPPNAKHRS